MTYTPRYTDWIDNRDDVDLETLPEKFLLLISAYQAAFRSWESAPEKEQSLYRKALEATDAYISVQLKMYFGDPEKSNSEDKKLKALLSKAADLDF